MTLHSQTCRIVSVLACSGALVLIQTGCGGAPEGPQRYHVSGTVNFKGKPVPIGMVTFSPDSKAGNSGPQGGTRIKAGEFDTSVAEGKGVIAGPQIVRIYGSDGVLYRNSLGEDNTDGRALFNPWETRVEIGPETLVHHFEVPEAAAKRLTTD